MPNLTVYKWTYTLTGEDNNDINTYIGPEEGLHNLAPNIKDILKKEDPGPYNQKMKMYQASIDEYKALGFFSF